MKLHLNAGWMLPVVLCIFFSAGQVAAEIVEMKQVGATKMILKVSPDGKALVDQDGREVARFSEGMQVVVPEAATEKNLPGCMCCTDDCILFEGDRCVKKIRTCQWDFDCSCK